MVILSIFLLNISYTPDLGNYKNAFYNTELSPDFLYTQLSIISYKLGFDFYSFYKLYTFFLIISIISVLYLYEANFYFVVTNLFIFNVFYPIVQIRYYFSFYLFLIYLKVKSTKLKKIALIISFFSHKTIILLFIVYYFQKICSEKLKINKMNLIILFNLSIFIFFKLINFSFFDNLLYFEKFKIYMYDENTLSGKLYFIIPYLLWMIYLMIVSRKIKNKFDDSKLFIPFYFITFSFVSIQIIYRYIIPFQFLIIIYLSNYYFKVNKRRKHFLLTCLCSILTFYWYYILPVNLGKKSDFIEVKKTYISTVEKNET